LPRASFTPEAHRATGCDFPSRPALYRVLIYVLQATSPTFKESGYQAWSGFDLPTKVMGLSPPVGTSESVIHFQADPWLDQLRAIPT